MRTRAWPGFNCGIGSFETASVGGELEARVRRRAFIVFGSMELVVGRVLIGLIEVVRCHI
jgi:hypothetical protein